MHEEVKKWLEENPDYKLVYVRKIAWDRADEWLEEMERTHGKDSLWQLETGEDGHKTLVLKEPWIDMYSDKVDDLEEEMLHYEYKEEKE